MERHKLLLSVVIRATLLVSLVALPLLAGAPAFAIKPDCTPRGIALGDCPEANAQINNGGVDVSASQGKPGSGEPGPRSPGSGAPGGSAKPPSAPPAPLVDPTGHDTYTVTLPVKVTDLVNFKPAPGVDHMEPNGWMIVGLDTNFYATVQSQVQSGLLLGQQASVRFTPFRYHWSYGDSHSANLGTKGATWSALGIHEFERTPTSHVYAKPGGYDIDLTIDFSAEYRYAGADWIPVAGTLPVPANRLHATAGDAKTVLVEHDCSVHPSGPGC